MATTSKRLLKAVQKHPIGTAALVGGTVVGAVLIGRAAHTASRLVTMKVAADAASEVARAVRGPAPRPASSSGGAKRAARGVKRAEGAKRAKKRPS